MKTTQKKWVYGKGKGIRYGEIRSHLTGVKVHEN
jgi:hypothetical protein